MKNSIYDQIGSMNIYFVIAHDFFLALALFNRNFGCEIGFLKTIKWTYLLVWMHA